MESEMLPDRMEGFLMENKRDYVVIFDSCVHCIICDSAKSVTSSAKDPPYVCDECKEAIIFAKSLKRKENKQNGYDK